jgi:hypothetical protein
MDPAHGVDIDRLHREMDASRGDTAETVQALRRKGREAMRWQGYVERHPGPILASAALFGIVAGRRIARAVSGNGRAGVGTQGPGDRDAAPFAPASVQRSGYDDAGAGRPPWNRLGSRVEGLVNRLIDEAADATERTVMPTLVSAVEGFFRKWNVRSGPSRVRPPAGD